MSNVDEPIKTPSEHLADRIILTLLEKKLVHPQEQYILENKLAGGMLRAENWRMVVENSIYKEMAGE